MIGIFQCHGMINSNKETQLFDVVVQYGITNYIEAKLRSLRAVNEIWKVKKNIV